MLVPACCHSCPSGYSHLVHALTSRTCAAQAQREALRILSCPKIVTSHRAMSCDTPHLSITHGTCTPSVTRPTSPSSDPLRGKLQPCADLRQLERGSLAEPPSFTVCGRHGGTGRLCAARWSRSRTCGLDIELHEILSKVRLSLCVQIWPGRNNQDSVWNRFMELWSRAAFFVTPWCFKKDEPPGVNLDWYAAWGPFSCGTAITNPSFVTGVIRR